MQHRTALCTALFVGSSLFSTGRAQVAQWRNCQERIVFHNATTLPGTLGVRVFPAQVWVNWSTRELRFTSASGRQLGFAGFTQNTFGSQVNIAAPATRGWPAGAVLTGVFSKTPRGVWQVNLTLQPIPASQAGQVSYQIVC